MANLMGSCAGHRGCDPSPASLPLPWTSHRIGFLSSPFSQEPHGEREAGEELSCEAKGIIPSSLSRAVPWPPQAMVFPAEPALPCVLHYCPRVGPYRKVK